MVTRPECTGKRDLSFSHWIRNTLRGSTDGLAVTDLDGVLDDFKRKRLMLIEVKTHNGSCTWSQWQTHSILDKSLNLTASAIGYNYWGYHVVRLSGVSPECSTGICVDGTQVSISELIAFLNMDRWPVRLPRRD